MKTNLITVPTFMFKQSESNNPIYVDYYNGLIVLRQDGEYEQQEQVSIDPDLVELLFKEIKRHKPTAEMILDR